MSHKLTIDYEVGPAVFCRCIKCKRKCFYLKYKVFECNTKRAFAPVIHMVTKLQQTVEYLKGHHKNNSMSTAYFGQEDMKMTELMIEYNCEELDVKDIIE